MDKEIGKDKDKKKPKASADVRLDRKSGTGMDKNPKKGGAGGKYTWGDETKPGVPTDKLDPKDPYYKDEMEEKAAAAAKKK